MTTRPVRLALLAASPMPYQVPLYRLLAQSPQIDFTVIYASSGGVRAHDAGYGQEIQWDVDLLGGYRSIFLRRSESNPIGGSFFALSDFDIVSHLRRERYEALWVHGYNFLTHELAAMTQLLLGAPLLFREEQTLLDSRSLWKRLLKSALLPRLFRRSSALYIGSENFKWFSRYGIPPNKMFSVPYCVENQRFRADHARLRPMRSALRARFGIDIDAPLILSVGRMTPKKQPLFLLEAFKRVRACRPCAMLMVGSGELEGAVREKVRTERIPDVHLAGFLNQSEISNAYACADIFVLASKTHETWGLVVNEAMNFGLPLIVSNKVGCATDLVREGRNGFVVDSEEPGQLEAKLSALVASAEMRREFGAASLRIVDDWTYEVAGIGVLAATADAVGIERWNDSPGARSLVAQRTPMDVRRVGGGLEVSQP
jgi:glycosyltransferase involved in cell wall biosynthesis